MEIVLLIVLWIIAAVAADGHSFGFAIFLIFASLAVIAWRSRTKVAELRERLEQQIKDAAGVRAELWQVAQELRQLRTQITASAGSSAPTAVPPKTDIPPASAPEPVPVTVQGPKLVPQSTPPAPIPKIEPIRPAFPPVSASPSQIPPARGTVPPSPGMEDAVPPRSRANESATPPLAARTVAPASPGMRVPPIVSQSPRMAAPQKLKKALDLEELVGRNVLPKAGIFLLVIGLVGWIATQWRNIPPIGKDALLLAVAGLLLGLGIFLARRERYQLFGRVLIGGGWSMLFYTSYALYHVSATRVLHEQWTGLVIMLVTAAVMVWHTLRYRSQVVTGIAFLLAFSTVTLSQETVFSLIAGAVLAVSLVVLVQRMRWYELEVFGILASYLNHFRFLFPIIGMGNGRRMFPQFYASTALLIFYWAVFRGSYVARRTLSKHEENVSTLACLLNPFLLLGLMKYQSARPELAFYALLALGAIEFALGLLPVTRQRRIAFLILTSLGSTLMIAAVPFKFSGMNTAVLWLAGAEALLIAGVLAREVAFRRLGMLAGLLTAAHVLAVDVRPWFEGMLNGVAVPHDFAQGALLIFCASVLFCDAHLLQLRWRELFVPLWDRRLLSALSYAAGVVAFCAVWITVPSFAVAVGWAGLMFFFAFAGKRLARAELTIQTVLLALCVAVRIFAVNLQADAPRLAVTRMWTVALVAAIFYLSARFTELPQIEAPLRAFFQWTATAMVAALLWVELPLHWIAPAWTLFAIVLTLAGRRLRLQPLLHQCYALSMAASLLAIGANWPLEQKFGPLSSLSLSLRLVTVVLVAAGLYALSILAQPLKPDGRHVVRAAFNTGAMFLLGGLIWFETGETWSAVFWSAFATVLLVLWRRLNFEEFFWHAHVLAVAALVNAYAFDMFSAARLHGVSARLITVILVAAMFYSDAWLAAKRIESGWRVQIGDLYSWAASLLVTTLLWHELRPIDVALGWAIFGIVLFEIGLERKLGSLRWQGGIALCASFVRIFFVNLNAIGAPGHLSPRVYSIAPLALIYLYVYWRTLAREEAFGSSRWKQLAPMLFSTLGVASIAFLMRFEVSPPNVVVFWAVLTVVLLAVARWSSRAVFLYQAIVLAVCTTVRTMMYNLVTPSYFSLADVRARTVGEVIALFLLALFFAFRLRATPPADLMADGPGARKWMRRASMRPEQLFFFAAIAMLTPLIAVEMARGQITIGWGVEAVLVFLLALAVGERSFRLCGLGLLLLCVGKLCVDVWNMNTGDRTISMTVLGAVLLLISFLYNRYRETIRKYL